jgi:integrase/recombinase XerD
MEDRIGVRVPNLEKGFDVDDDSVQENALFAIPEGDWLMLVKRRHSRPIPQGAVLFEKNSKRYARWTTVSGKTQTRPLNRKGDRVVEESCCWYVRFRHPETGRWKEWKAYQDRQSSQAMEVEILKQLERGAAGIVDRTSTYRQTTIEAHLEAFEEHLEDKNNTREHIDKTLSRCRRILGQLNVKVVGDITQEGVEMTLASFRRVGMSLSTSNGYFRAMRSFCGWLKRTRRITENPLEGLSCVKVTDADVKRKRRPLNDREVAQLISTTRQSLESYAGLLGQDRAMLYLVAIHTGLRAGELASLTPESFDLDAHPPMVRCRGGYTKNGQEAELPLRSDVAEKLRNWLRDKPAGEFVWPGTWASHRHGAEMLRNDLHAADIEYEDGRGRVVDFHALRHTFISNLARAGVYPRNAQALARHSTIDLTMNVYTHVNMNDLARDIELLPAVEVADKSGIIPNEGENIPASAEQTMPDELAGLMTNPSPLRSVVASWDSLPDHIRNAISTLAGV